MNNVSKVLRKTICIALAAVTLGGFAAIVPAVSDNSLVAQAASVLNYQDYQYQVVTDDYAVITKYTGKEAEVVVPESIHDFRIISIGTSAFSGNELIKKVTLPEGVTTIESGVFNKCPNLEEVVIPGTVESIGYRAFYDCPSLKTVNLPQSLKKIGSSAFEYCLALEEITIPGGVAEIPWQAFKDCSALKNVQFTDPEDEQAITTIGFEAFSGCTSLEEIAIPEYTQTIDEAAFRGCTALKNVEFNEGLTSIGIASFYNCPSLLEVTVPSSVEKIGKYALSYTYNKAVRKFIPHPDFVITSTTGSAAQTYAQKNGLKFIADDPLENTSDISDQIIKAGKVVTIFGSAKGGSGEYTYSYYFKRAKNDTWKLLGGQENTTATSVSFKPTEDTIYDVLVKVKDSEGNIAESEFRLFPEKDIIVNCSTVSSKKINLGGNVTIYGSASMIVYDSPSEDEVMTYTYYFKRSSNSSWKLLGQADTENTTARFKPTAAGKYDIKVVAKFGDMTDEKTFVVNVTE